MDLGSNTPTQGKLHGTYGVVMLSSVTVIMIIVILLLSYIFVRARYAVPLLVSSGGANDRAPLNASHLDHNGVEIGIDDETLNSFPRMSYSEKVGRSFNSAEGNESEEAEGKKCCSICLSDYKEPEVVRVIPDCSHMFHVDCIDEWLRLHPTCPVCRTSPLPSRRTSLSLTPEAAASAILTVHDRDAMSSFPA